MRRVLAALSAVGVLAGGLALAGTAQADTQICDQYGTTTIEGGRYIVQNNRWGAETPQCINVTDSGFSITTADHNKATNGAPASYPSVYLGCHYDNCTTGSNLPMKVSDISSATSSIDYSYTGGTYNAAYDIWLDPTSRTTGQNGTEIMIWFNRQGSIQPIGSPVGTAEIDGRTWEVWSGNIGWNVVSYVAPSAIGSWDFNVKSFIDDVQQRGAITDDWYLTSIQAGFEPWIGGAGLAVNDFSASVNGGGTTPPPTPTTQPPTTEPPTTEPPTTQPPTTEPPTTEPPTTEPPTTQPPTTPPPGDGTGACKVTYNSHAWNAGFVSYLKVTNTGSSTIDGWTVGFDLSDGQQLHGGWSADWSVSGSSLAARNLSWNRGIAPGASVDIGFRADHSGNTAAPSAFTLNGTACEQ